MDLRNDFLANEVNGKHGYKMNFGSVKSSIILDFCVEIRAESAGKRNTQVK